MTACRTSRGAVAQALPLLALLLFAGLALGCSGGGMVRVPVVVPPLGGEIVSVPAEDGFPLAGTLMRDRTSTRGVVCLHGWDDNRTSFDPLLQALAQRGFNALALDLRGRHASVGRPEEQRTAHERYLARDREWFRQMTLDVQAAKQYLIEACGCDPRRIAVVGAGVGATIGILAAAADPELAAFVLLSPGWRYLGLDVRREMQALAGRPVLATYVSHNRGEAEAVEMLQAALGESAATLTLKPVRTTYRFGHGTRALRHDEKLSSQLAEHLVRAIP